jgi:hypothetical protein
MPTDDRCAQCHQEIADEQRSSLHRAAWQNGYFLRSYARERGPFCRKCHAPDADPGAEPPREAQEAGVGCSVCHVVPAGIVGSRAVPAREGGHEVIGDARLATPAACAACHAFALPAPPGFDAGPMQDTIGEHRRSAASETACQGCHMPLVPSRGGGAHHAHGFRVQRDRAMLAEAVVVKDAALEAGTLRLSIAPGRVGHAFPTGDLYRRVEVRAEPVDAAGRALGGGSAEVLGRTFTLKRVGRDALVRVQMADTRLDGPRTIALALPAWARRARWQIVWQRLPPPLAAELGMTMSEQETVVLEGVVTR